MMAFEVKRLFEVHVTDQVTRGYVSISVEDGRVLVSKMDSRDIETGEFLQFEPDEARYVAQALIEAADAIGREDRGPWGPSGVAIVPAGTVILEDGGE